MANYQLKYNVFFDPLGDVSDTPVYTVQILQKDYTGNVTSVTGAGTPVIHEYQTDDPKAPIKGSSVTLTLINDGTLPLSSFYSVEDDTFKVKLLWGSQVLFEGFLVQDDCIEDMLDYTHEISLSANDNLGLLKDLALNKSDLAYVFTNYGSLSFSSTEPHTLSLPPSIGINIQPGDKIKITGSSVAGTYTLNTVTTGDPNYTVTVLEEILTQSTTTATFEVGKLALLDKKPLINVIGMCLGLTGLDLSLYVWGQINETSQDSTKCWLEETLIDPGTFEKDDRTYEDCYTVLTEILASVNATLFQAEGAWHIMRWDELRYNGNNLTAFVYNSDMTLTGYSIMKIPFDAGRKEDGKTTFAETGLQNRILRPVSYVKETFNFKQPGEILRNYDLTELGTLLREYNVDIWLWGGNVYYSYDSAVDSAPSGATIIKSFYKYREYTALCWYDSGLAPQTADYFIRVVTDNLDNEVERYLCAKNDNVKSYKIEVNAGDVFSFSFSYRTQDSQSSGGSYITNTFIIELNDGTNRRFFKTTGWEIGSGYVYQVGPNDNTDSWHTVTIDATNYPVPFNGLLYVYLSGTADLTGTQNYTYTKDIRLDYTAAINQTTKITGQTHDINQAGNVKNVIDTEIYMDSSPRNSIAGTLFLNEMDGVIQKRATKWEHPYLPTQSAENLGHLVTFEQMFWRHKPRTIIEGTMQGLIRPDNIPYGLAISTVIGLDGNETLTFSFTSTPAGTTSINVGYFNGQWNNSNHPATSPITLTIPGGNYAYRIYFLGTDHWYYFNGQSAHFSILSLLTYSAFLGRYFVPGKLSIDYKNDKFTGTLWEIWDDGELDSDITDTYVFNYLYSPI